MPEKQAQEFSSALNIVLLPPPEFSQRAIDFSGTIADHYPTEFRLDTTNFRPHITLFHGVYPNKNVAGLLRHIEQFAQQQDFSTIQLDHFSTYHTFIYWNVLKNPTLQKRHEEILQIANPYRENLLSPSTTSMIPLLNPQEQAMVRKTGSILNLELYLPHITLSRLKNPEQVEQGKDTLGEATAMPFTPSKIAVCKMGDHGTISESIAEFSLRTLVSRK